MKPPLPRLHAITDARIARRPDLDVVAGALVGAAGPELAIHARGQDLTGLEHYELALRLARLSARIIVNGRLDVALAVPSIGVQLGHGSLPVSAARALDPQWWIRKSVDNLIDPAPQT